MHYRLYFCDAANQITSYDQFECVDDELAQFIAAQRGQDTTYELWNRERLVIRVASSVEATLPKKWVGYR